MLERLKLEQEVDIFQSTKHVRINRPQLVPTLVSSSAALCHTVIMANSVALCQSLWQTVLPSVTRSLWQIVLPSVTVIVANLEW